MERYLYYGCDVYKEITNNGIIDENALYAASIAEIITRFDISFNKRLSILETFINSHPYSKFDIEINYDFIELILMFISQFEDENNVDDYNEIYNWFANNGIEFMDQYIEYNSEEEDSEFAPSEHEEDDNDMINTIPTDEEYNIEEEE